MVWKDENIWNRMLTLSKASALQTLTGSDTQSCASSLSTSSISLMPPPVCLAPTGRHQVIGAAVPGPGICVSLSQSPQRCRASWPGWRAACAGLLHPEGPGIPAEHSLLLLIQGPCGFYFSRRWKWGASALNTLRLQWVWPCWCGQVRSGPPSLPLSLPPSPDVLLVLWLHALTASTVCGS